MSGSVGSNAGVSPSTAREKEWLALLKRVAGGLQWLLDDMSDAGEAVDEKGVLSDSVREATHSLRLAKLVLSGKKALSEVVAEVETPAPEGFDCICETIPDAEVVGWRYEPL